MYTIRPANGTSLASVDQYLENIKQTKTLRERQKGRDQMKKKHCPNEVKNSYRWIHSQLNKIIPLKVVK